MQTLRGQAEALSKELVSVQDMLEGAAARLRRAYEAQRVHAKTGARCLPVADAPPDIIDDDDLPLVPP